MLIFLEVFFCIPFHGRDKRIDLTFDKSGDFLFYLCFLSKRLHKFPSCLFSSSWNAWMCAKFSTNCRNISVIEKLKSFIIQSHHAAGFTWQNSSSKNKELFTKFNKWRAKSLSMRKWWAHRVFTLYMYFSRDTNKDRKGAVEFLITNSFSQKEDASLKTRWLGDALLCYAMHEALFLRHLTFVVIVHVCRWYFRNLISRKHFVKW